MPDQVSKIFGPETLAKVNAALASLTDAENELELAKRAGLADAMGSARFDQIVAQVQQNKAALMGFKNVYFPGQ